MSIYLFDINSMQAPIRSTGLQTRIRAGLGVQVSGGGCGLLPDGNDMGQINGALINALAEADERQSIFVGESGELLYEYEMEDEVFCLSYSTESGLLRGGVVDKITERVRQYTLLPDHDTAEAIFGLLLYYSRHHLSEPNLYNLIDLFHERWINNEAVDDDLSQITAKICDNIKVRVEQADELSASVGVKISVPTTNIVPLTKSDIFDADNVGVQMRWFGRSNLLTNSIRSPKELAGRFRTSNRKFTTEEQKQFPILNEKHVVAPESVEICESIYHSTGTGYPLRNFLLTGPAGLGKTEMCQAVAMGVTLPYVYYTCSASTEEFNFIGQMLPRTEDGQVAASGVWSESNLPTAMDILNDPGTAMSIMTGVYKETATEAECIELALKIAQAVIADYKRQTNAGGQAQFRYVRTPFIDAIENGYLVEIQEPSVIVQPGVLVGLNSLLEKDGGITLVTGEFIRRHPDTVIILTSNTDYVACRDVDQSLLSRMDEVYDFPNLSKETMVSRVKSKLGFSDELLLVQMANTIVDIQKKCKEKRINDGSIGMRELLAWVSKYNIIKDPVKAAKRTIIPSATRNKDRQQDLIRDCLKTNFAA